MMDQIKREKSPDEEAREEDEHQYRSSALALVELDEKSVIVTSSVSELCNDR
jgi:hypothetical protein